MTLEELQNGISGIVGKIEGVVSDKPLASIGGAALGGVVANGDASVTCTAEVSAYANADFAGAASVSCNASITVNASNGQSWEVVVESDNTWSPVSSDSNAWTPISVSDNTWSDVAASSNTWAQSSNGNNSWQLQH